MSGSDIKNLVGEFFAEAFTRGNLGHLATLPEDFVLHNFDTTIRGRDAWIDAVVRPSFAAFPDLRFEAEFILAEDDKVAIRWHARGTNNGPFQGQAPSGKTVSFTGSIIYRVDEGRIVEAWAQPDRLGLMQQMGLT